MTLNPHIKLALDILPLAIFFIGFKWLGLFVATELLLITTFSVLVFTYILTRRIALSPLITAIMVIVFGGLTLWLHDEQFIKIKPTLIYLIFATILLVGCVLKKNLFKPLLGDALALTERGWWLLSLRWGFFFIFLAALNEIIRRNFSTDFWVNFKVFGCLGLTMLFMVLQTGLINRYSILQPVEEKDTV